MVIVSWTTRPSESNLADRDDGTQKKPKKKNYQISVKQYVLHFVKSALPLPLDILADCFVSELVLGFTWTPAKSWNLSLKKNNKLLDTAAKVTTNIFNSSLNKPNLVWLYFASGVLWLVEEFEGTAKSIGKHQALRLHMMT